MKLKGGIIGFGRMGITHFSILNTHPAVEIAAICEPSSTMKGILNKYLDVDIFSDYQRMINDSELDFVVISTPADSHADIIRAAIQKDFHVFSEKPFTLSAAESQGILSSLEGKKLVNQVGYVNRFNEVFMHVKEILDQGLIGDVKLFSSEMYGATVLKDSKSSWRNKRRTGGGCMYEFASHCIDLVIYFLGKPDSVTGSFMQHIYSSEVEDLIASTFIYQNGPIGRIMVNWSDETFRKPTNIITFFGTGGKIIADKHGYKIFLKQANPTYDFKVGWNTRSITDFGKSVRFYVRGNEFTRQLDYFIDCIEQQSADNISGFDHACQTDVVMEDIIEDASGMNDKNEKLIFVSDNNGRLTPKASRRWNFIKHSLEK